MLRLGPQGQEKKRCDRLLSGLLWPEHKMVSVKARSALVCFQPVSSIVYKFTVQSVRAIINIL